MADLPEIIIESQNQYNLALQKKLHLTNQLVIEDSKDVITVHTDVVVGKNGRCKVEDNSKPLTITARANGIVSAEGKNNIIGYDNANILAKGNCKVTMHDNAHGNCYEHCQITLKDQANTAAVDNCTVHAFDETSVSAFGNTKVYTYQKATAKGSDISSLSGKDNSTLYGEKNCKIQAQDNCIVYASENCTVQVADSCLVVAETAAKITSQDNCLIMTNGNPEVKLMDKCEHLNLDNITDKNIMGALKQIAQTKAAADRPYQAIQILKDKIPAQRKDAVNRRLNTMGLKDQTAAKNYLYSLIEAEPAQKNQQAAPSAALERQLETARKAGFVQGVCECVAVVGNEQNMGKKLLTEMNVTKDMAKKFANPETFKELEKGIFAQKQKLEQTNTFKR